MTYIKEILPKRAGVSTIVEALRITEVSESRMQELELLYNRHKGHKRVLFVKESSLGINHSHELTTDRTVLKTLPNLPNDDDDLVDYTQRELDEEENLSSS